MEPRRRHRRARLPAGPQPRPGSLARLVRRERTADDVAAYDDRAGGTYRAAAFANGRIELCLFSGVFEEQVEWDAVKAMFEQGAVSAEERRMLLSGRSGDGLAGIRADRLCLLRRRTQHDRRGDQWRRLLVAAIGASLKAGTNCGSCIPELKRMLAQAAPAPAKQSEPEPLTA